MLKNVLYTYFRGKVKKRIKWTNGKDTRETTVSEYDKLVPVITGRCLGSLWMNDGVGQLTNIPPRSDEWWAVWEAGQCSGM